MTETNSSPAISGGRSKTAIEGFTASLALGPEDFDVEVKLVERATPPRPAWRPARLFLVVLDLRTGRELVRVRVRGTRPSMGQIFVGRGAVYYVAAQTGRRHGYVTRITAGRR